MIFCRMAQNIFLMKVLKKWNFLQVGKKSIRRAESNFRGQKTEGQIFVLEVRGVKNGVKRHASYGFYSENLRITITKIDLRG